MEFYQQILGAISIILSLLSSQIGGVNNSVIPVIPIKQVVVKPVIKPVVPVVPEIVRKNIMGWFDVGESFKCCNEEKSCTCQLREYRKYESNKSDAKYVVTNKKMFQENCKKCICDKACVIDLNSTKTFYNEIVREYFSTQEGECPKDCDIVADNSCGITHLNCSANNYWQKNNMLKDGKALEEYAEHDWYEYAEFYCLQGGCRKRIAKYKFCLEDKCVESVSLPIVW